MISTNFTSRITPTSPDFAAACIKRAGCKSLALFMHLELPSIGWQLFALGSPQSDSTAILPFLATYATRLLTEVLIHRSAWRNCLENSRGSFKNASSVARSGRSGPFDPSWPPPKPLFRDTSRFSKQFRKVNSPKFAVASDPLSAAVITREELRRELYALRR